MGEPMRPDGRVMEAEDEVVDYDCIGGGDCCSGQWAGGAFERAVGA